MILDKDKYRRSTKDKKDKYVYDANRYYKESDHNRKRTQNAHEEASAARLGGDRKRTRALTNRKVFPALRKRWWTGKMAPARTSTTAKSEKLPQTQSSASRPSALRERERATERERVCVCRREAHLLFIDFRQILWRKAGPCIGRVGRPRAALDSVRAVLFMSPD
jgi:hypothetical protein